MKRMLFLSSFVSIYFELVFMIMKFFDESMQQVFQSCKIEIIQN